MVPGEKVADAAKEGPIARFHTSNLKLKWGVQWTSYRK